MNRRTVIVLMLAMFVLMMACTPSSLFRGNNARGSKTAELLTTEDPAPADIIPVEETSVVSVPTPVDTVVQAATDAETVAQQELQSTEEPTSTVADVVRSDSTTAVQATSDTLAPVEIPADMEPATAKLKRDTMDMDSLELLVYKRNKAIDDSLALDSINRKKKNGIDSPVKYSANDSLVYVAGVGMAYLYGDSHVEYQNMDLKSENIYMCLDSSLVHATGARDSATNRLKGTPVFKMGSDTYENTEMSFNFKTKKGLITDVYTKQEDGYLTSELSKRGSNGELFLQHGRYTTCDEPHPDFYLALSRAKVRPGKDVVFGPAYLVVCDVPLPLAIPYGFFPFTKSYSSGFIMPTYGDETERGFYLRDGGYYFAVSDKMDLKLLGEIYTKGSWGLQVSSNYRKRYRYSGSFLASYQNSITGEKNMPDYAKETSFKINWTHTQDQKGNPYSNLSARVNFATTSYERNNLTSMYNPQSMTQSTRTSSVSWKTDFSSIGLSLSSQFRINQNMRDSTIDLTLPDLSITVSRFYPFRRKKMVGAERWYEKISMSYTGQFNNSVTAKEDQLMHTSFKRDWVNSMQHSIPISANFTLFDVLNVNPSINFSDQTSFRKVNKSWDEQTQNEVTDTLTGLYNIYRWSLNMSLSTKLYGFYIPNRKLFGDKIDQIRHVLTPSVSFSYSPDFGAKRYGYYETYQKTDAEGNVSLVEYSPYQIGGVAPPGKGMSGTIGLDLKNNLEMKVRDSNDSLRKVSLIDELGMNMSYNMASKNQPWSPLTMNVRLKLTKSYTFNFNATFKSYIYEADSVGATPHESMTTTYWEQGKWGRFQGMSQNLSYTLDNTKIANLFKWLRGEKVEKKKNNQRDEDTEDDEYEDALNPNVDKDMEKAKHGAESKGKAETDEDGYLTFSMPWSISFGYGITMRENTGGNFNYNTMRYPYAFSQNLNLSGNIRLAEGWNISFSSGYDFDNHKISMTTASLSRDLHCFNMSCSVVLAPYTSYNFSFRCNASTLTDALKYDKRSGYSNSVQWY